MTRIPIPGGPDLGIMAALAYADLVKGEITAALRAGDRAWAQNLSDFYRQLQELLGDYA